MKKFLLTILSLILVLPVFAFEDCLMMSNGKLNNIKIQHNDIIDVFPLITIMNDKNTIIIHPLKEGTTKFSVVKNDKERYIFTVRVTEDNTFVETKDGFEVLNIDCPPGSYEYYFDLDEPPAIGEEDNYIKNLDEPPFLKEEL